MTNKALTLATASFIFACTFTVTIQDENTSTTVFAVANLILALSVGFVYVSLIRRGKR